MKQIPTCAEAKAHAKYLSRSLNINLSYARDAVALRYNYHNWSEVSLADKYMSCYGLASHEEKRVFSQLLAPYIAELQNVIHPDRHVRKA